MKDQNDDILDKNNMEIDKKFESSLLNKLQKEEKRLRGKQAKKTKGWKYLKPISGLGFVSLLVAGVLILNTTGTTVQPVLAYDVFNDLKNQPIGTAELIENIEQQELSEGTFVHKRTTFANGDGYMMCVYGTEEEPYPNAGEYTGLESIDTLIYLDPPELEVLFEIEKGNKATPPIQFIDENIDFNRLAKLLGADEGQYNYIREIGTLVDSQGNELDQNAELEAEVYQGTEVYRLYITNATKGLCDDSDKLEIVELVVRVNDLAILEFNVYNGSAESADLVISTMTEFVTEETGSFETFLPKFEELGFDEDAARQNAEMYFEGYENSNGSNEDITDFFSADLFSAWGSSFNPLNSYDENTPDAERIITYNFDDRGDMNLWLIGSDLRPEGGGDFPIGRLGFEKEIAENGSTLYRDVYINLLMAEKPDLTFSPGLEYITGDTITELTIGGKEAITVLVDGPYQGQGKLFYTIINTGNEDFPAVVVRENADQHFQFEDNWQTFVDSVSFFE